MIALQQLNATEFNIIMLFLLLQETELESEHRTFHRSSSSAASVLLVFVDSHTSVSMHVEKDFYTKNSDRTRGNCLKPQE